MMHPLLSLRLYCQPRAAAPLPRRRERERHPVRDFVMRSVSGLYRRWGSGLGFIVGLALALWLWLPSSFR